MPKITNEESALAYFKGQSREVCCILSSRAALRVLGAIATEPEPHFLRLSLTSLRATLTSAGRGSGRPADVGWIEEASSAASASSAAAYSAAHSASASSAAYSSFASSASSAAYSSFASSAAFSAAHSAHSAAYSSFASSAAAYSALSQDTEAPGFNSPVWPDGEAPQKILDNHQSFLKRLRAAGVLWLPDWYEAMWHGTFNDWDFALEVAKIDNDTWDAGLDTVNQAIRDLQAGRLSDRLTQAEEITTDANGDFIVQTTLVDPHVIIKTIQKDLGKILDKVERSNACSMNNMCLAFDYLNTARTEAPDDPRAVESNLVIARGIIARKLERGDYTREDVIETVVDVVNKSVLEIWATHPALREIREEVATLEPKPRGADARAELSDALTVVADGKTAGILKIELKLDSRAIVEEPGSAEETQAVARLGSRAGKMMQKLGEMIKAAKDSPGMALVGIFNALKKAVEILFQWLF